MEIRMQWEWTHLFANTLNTVRNEGDWMCVCARVCEARKNRVKGWKRAQGVSVFTFLVMIHYRLKKQDSFWRTDSRSTGLEIPRLLCNPKIY
jgi:hypothetical protein